MLENYLERFKAMVDELRKHPEISVKEFAVMEPATPEELAEAEAYHQLVPGMREFYSQCNGLKLEWEYTGTRFVELGSPLSHVVGFIDIWPVQHTFKDQEGLLYFDEGDKFKGLHPIDFYVPEACVAIRFEGNMQPEMYYHYCGEEMSPIGMDFATYMERLLESRGYWYWPKALAEPEYFNEYNPVSYEEAGFRLVMPELFPNFNNANFPSIDGRTPPLSALDDLVNHGGGTADLSNYKYARSLGAKAGAAPTLQQSNMGTAMTAAGPGELMDGKPAQKKMMMAVLAFFAGNFGIHRYLMGHKNWWLMPLTCGLCGFWALADTVMILTGNLKMADGRDLLE